jgi:hypothetical protein
MRAAVGFQCPRDDAIESACQRTADQGQGHVNNGRQAMNGKAQESRRDGAE